MPAERHESTPPRPALAKVKREPLSHPSTSAAHAPTSAGAALSATDEGSLEPRSVQEASMVAHLRDMGFADTHEMVTALRAVAADRAEVALVAEHGMVWSAHEHVEAAMLWIVSQREEVAEAHKLDRARLSSERAEAAAEHARRQGRARELGTANLGDLIGSMDLVEIRSKYFPCSVLLQNRRVKAVLRAIASESPGKAGVIRLLSLEKKARHWYGTVLPFSYFAYVLRPDLEGYRRHPRDAACPPLERECARLEQAMFHLSEQEEGGVGRVPALFLAAQRDARRRNRPTSDDAACDDDDDVQTIPPLPRRPASTPGKEGGTRRPPLDCVDLT